MYYCKEHGATGTIEICQQCRTTQDFDNKVMLIALKYIGETRDGDNAENMTGDNAEAMMICAQEALATVQRKQ